MKNDEWTMSQEREHMENLLNQRVNFTVVVLSLLVVSISACDKQIELIVLLVFGLLLIFFLSVSVFRCQLKLDIILEKHIFICPSHPCTRIHKDAKRYKIPSSRKLVGYGVPILCVFFVFTLLVLSILNIYTV